MIPTLFYTVLLGFLDFSQKPLAAQPLPLGGTLNVGFVLGSRMNRLAAMNICQAARHCLRFSFGLRLRRGHWDF